MSPHTRRFLTDYQLFSKVAESLIPTTALKQLDSLEYARVDLTDFRLCGITEEGMNYSAEYNDSCGCHPEYQTAYTWVYWADIADVIAQQYDGQTNNESPEAAMLPDYPIKAPLSAHASSERIKYLERQRAELLAVLKAQEQHPDPADWAPSPDEQEPS